MRRNGIELKDLIHLSLKDFLLKFPELKYVDKNLVLDRFNHFNSKQLEKIKCVKDDRINLITNPGLSTLKGLQMSQLSQFGSSRLLPNNEISKISSIGESTILKNLQDEQSTAIKNEQIKLDKLKQKQVNITYVY